MDLRLIYGNRYLRVKPKSDRGLAAHNIHNWTIFVKFADKSIVPNRLVEKVRFHMHPSFGVDYMDARAPKENGCYELNFTGYATFEVYIEIFFKHATGHRKIDLNHLLSFEGKGKWNNSSLQIKKSVAKKLNIHLR